MKQIDLPHKSLIADWNCAVVELLKKLFDFSWFKSMPRLKKIVTIYLF